MSKKSLLSAAPHGIPLVFVTAAAALLLAVALVTSTMIQSAYAESFAKAFAPGQLKTESESAKVFAPGQFPVDPLRNAPGQIQKDIRTD